MRLSERDHSRNHYGMGLLTAVLLTLCLSPQIDAAEPVAENECLRILSPNGGEVFRIGDTVTVTFDVVDDNIDMETDVRIHLFRNNFLLIEDIQGENKSLVLSDASCKWVVPDSYYIFPQGNLPMPTGNNFNLKLQFYEEPPVLSDMCDAPFSITGKDGIAHFRPEYHKLQPANQPASISILNSRVFSSGALFSPDGRLILREVSGGANGMRPYGIAQGIIVHKPDSN
jgi:hypothetical protein